jgi:hypothetical protein
MDSIKACVRANAGPLAFVWGLWLTLSVVMLKFVRAFGVNFPYYDEWELVPALTGNQPITLSWLWSQHNEHRIFLPRLLYLAVMKLANNDFRAGMYFDAFALIACSAALIAVAHRQRGRLAYTDAFFPLLLLHVGQAQNLVNGFQIAFVAGTLIATLILALFGSPGPLGFRAALAVGVCTLLLPLVGGHGVSLVPALALCALWSAWRIRAEANGVRKAAATVLLAALASALSGFYFVGYEHPLKHPASPSLGATLTGAIQFLTVGLGAATRQGWPWVRAPFIAAVAASLGALLFVVVRRPTERDRALRMGLFAGAFVSLALGIGWARNALAPDALFASRYVSLAVPFWCALYLGWELVHRRIRRFAQTCLFVCAAALVIPNYTDGETEAVFYRDVRLGPYRDVVAGVRLKKLLARHQAQLYYGEPRDLGNRMRMLNRARVGVFKRLR